MTWPNGDQYEGEWKNGVEEGQGEMRYANGVVQKGIYKNGKFVELCVFKTKWTF